MAVRRIADNKVVINDNFLEIQKRGKRGLGKARVQIEITAEPLVHDLQDRALGAGPAEAIGEVIRKQVGSVDRQVAETTEDARRYTQDAFERGARWATKRLSGGRIGPTPITDTAAPWFQSSGRMRDGIIARETRTGGSGWTVNVPGNRLQRKDFKNFSAWVAEFQKLVPGVGNPKTLMATKEVNAALRESQAMMITKISSRGGALSARNARAKMQAIKAAAALGKSLL